MLVGWGILSPISKHYNWAPGPVGDMTTGARGWILWTSLAIMSSDSLVALIPIAWEYAGKLIERPDVDGHRPDHDLDDETDDRLVPTRWVLWGIACSAVVGILVVWLVFGGEGIKPWATAISFILGALLSILGYVLCCSLYAVSYSLKGSCSWGNRPQPCQRPGQNQPTDICGHSARKCRR